MPDIKPNCSLSHDNFGFTWGAAKIARLCHDAKKGWVVIELQTPKTKLQLYVTKTGKVRIHDASGEWFKLEN